MYISNIGIYWEDQTDYVAHYCSAAITHDTAAVPFSHPQHYQIEALLMYNIRIIHVKTAYNGRGREFTVFAQWRVPPASKFLVLVVPHWQNVCCTRITNATLRPYSSCTVLLLLLLSHSNPDTLIFYKSNVRELHMWET